MAVYSIAGMPVEINVPGSILNPNFEKFADGKKNARCHFNILPKKDIPSVPEDAFITSKDHIHTVYENKSHIYKVNNDDNMIILTVITSDWTDISIYVNPQILEDAENKEENIFYISSELRQLTGAVMIKHNNGFFIHSASVEYKNKGIIFSAPSGVGKSTQAHLWQKYHNVRIIDGDVNACRITEGRPFVCGLPWCGTSGECVNDCAPLGAIVFLEQAEENNIRKLPVDEAFARLISRSFLPFTISRSLTEQGAAIINEICDTTDCFHLKCRIDFEAVEILRKCLE